MKHEEFEKLCKRRYDQSYKVLVEKGKEYATSEDAMESFKSQAELSMHKTPMGIGWELMVKHLYSVRRIIAEHEANLKLPSQEMLDEKFGDAINYLILIEALFSEKITNREMLNGLSKLDYGFTPEVEKEVNKVASTIEQAAFDKTFNAETPSADK